MKKILAAILALLALTLTSCGNTGAQTDAPDGYALFANDAVDYTFCYPTDWEVDYQTGISSIQKNTASSSVYASYARVSVMAFDASTDGAKAYWASYKKDIAATYGNYEDLGESEIKLDDAAALRVKYKASLTPNPEDESAEKPTVYTFEQVICVRNGSVYIITFSATAEDYEDCLAGFEAVLQYFSFKKDLINNLF